MNRIVSSSKHPQRLVAGGVLYAQLMQATVLLDAWACLCAAPLPKARGKEVMVMNLRAWLTLGLLAFGAPAAAQEVPNSPDYHARHNPQSVYYQGPGQQPAQQQPPQPTGYWEKTWGAIAPSPQGGVLGTALGASSKEEAERLALEDCKAKGGACKVLSTYFNQCGAMVLGRDQMFTARAGSESEASEEAVEYCQETEGSDTNCRVYYSACTEPIFHKY